MRVFLELHCTITGTVPVNIDWVGGERVTVDHEELKHRPDPPLAIELTVSDTGEVTHVWLGPDGKLSSVPVELASALIGPDTPARRARLLLLGTLRERGLVTWVDAADARTRTVVATGGAP